MKQAVSKRHSQGIAAMPISAVVVLGSRPVGPQSWDLPPHIYASLDRAAELITANTASYIIVSGKWTINFDVLGIKQPFTESGLMADYLLERNISVDRILQETESEDTISNLYYLKTLLCIPRELKTLHFVAAKARLPRIAFLADRILGPAYTLTFEGVPYKKTDVSTHEARTQAKQAAFLAPMADGDHQWLTGKFYDDPYYVAVKQRILGRAHLEPFLHLAKRLPK